MDVTFILLLTLAGPVQEPIMASAFQQPSLEQPVQGQPKPAPIQGQPPPLPPDQPGPGPMRGQPGRPPDDIAARMSPAEIQKIFDAYLIVQAQEALGLNETQFAQFLTRLRGLQDARRRNQQARLRIVNDLQRLTAPRNIRTSDEGVIKERLKELQDVEARAAGEVRQAYAALDEVLDVRQQARFRVFEEQIERKKLDLLLRARQNPANRPGPQRRPPGE